MDSPTAFETGSVSTAPESGHDAKWSEIRARWPIILGCILGIGCSAIAVPVVALSIFLKGLAQDFGWTRVEISLAHTVVVVGLLLTAPFVGIIGDRGAARGAAVFSLIMIGCAMLGFSQMSGNLGLFLIMIGVMTLLGSGASTVTFARIISTNFVRTRGLALGLAMSGSGLTSFILPLLLVPFVAAHGWRSGSTVIGIGILAIAPIVYLLLKGSSVSSTSPDRPKAEASAPGIPFAEAIVTPAFWVMAVAFALTSLGIGGMNVHFVSMLTDVGMSPERSGAIASMTGVSLIVIRLITGWLIDRFSVTIVACTMLLMSGVCLTIFATMGADFAVAGALANGLAFGSEIDIVGYLTARIFGMRAYGRLYGVLYGTILFGAALSPLGYAYAYQTFGSYLIALLLAAVSLTVAAILLMILPRLVTPFSSSMKEGT